MRVKKIDKQLSNINDNELLDENTLKIISLLEKLRIEVKEDREKLETDIDKNFELFRKEMHGKVSHIQNDFKIRLLAMEEALKKNNEKLQMMHEFNIQLQVINEQVKVNKDEINKIINKTDEHDKIIQKYNFNLAQKIVMIITIAASIILGADKLKIIEKILNLFPGG